MFLVTGSSSTSLPKETAIKVSSRFYSSTKFISTTSTYLSTSSLKHPTVQSTSVHPSNTNTTTTSTISTSTYSTSTSPSTQGKVEYIFIIKLKVYKSGKYRNQLPAKNIRHLKPLNQILLFISF